jgi:hypothetical protein
MAKLVNFGNERTRWTLLFGISCHLLGYYNCRLIDPLKAEDFECDFLRLRIHQRVSFRYLYSKRTRLEI